jgi:hypothetical protein
MVAGSSGWRLHRHDELEQQPATRHRLGGTAIEPVVGGGGVSGQVVRRLFDVPGVQLLVSEIVPIATGQHEFRRDLQQQRQVASRGQQTHESLHDVVVELIEAGGQPVPQKPRVAVAIGAVHAAEQQGAGSAPEGLLERGLSMHGQVRPGPAGVRRARPRADAHHRLARGRVDQRPYLENRCHLGRIRGTGASRPSSESASAATINGMTPEANRSCRSGSPLTGGTPAPAPLVQRRRGNPIRSSDDRCDITSPTTL